MAKDGSKTFLGRLKTAINKVRFLMNFNLNRWRLASVFRASSSNRRYLSFNDRLGLTQITDDIEDVSNHSGSSPHEIQRTLSFPSSEDDIDKRAELFIANFYRQLQIERQVSLELRYNRDASFGSSSISP